MEKVQEIFVRCTGFFLCSFLPRLMVWWQIPNKTQQMIHLKENTRRHGTEMPSFKLFISAIYR